MEVQMQTHAPHTNKQTHVYTYIHTYIQLYKHMKMRVLVQNVCVVAVNRCSWIRGCLTPCTPARSWRLAAAVTWHLFECFISSHEVKCIKALKVYLYVNADEHIIKSGEKNARNYNGNETSSYCWATARITMAWRKNHEEVAWKFQMLSLSVYCHSRIMQFALSWRWWF